MIVINDTILFFGVSLLISILLFLFVFIKDKQHRRRFATYEDSIEVINKTLYKIEKSIDDKVERLVGLAKQDLEKEIKNPLFSSIDEIRQNVNDHSDLAKTKVGNLEEKLKEYTSIPMSAQLDENKVLSMYNAGTCVADIAKELRCNESEVTFLLKVRGLV